MQTTSRHSRTVLVTGATGFVGTWIVKTLLERGYLVKCAVRSDAKAQYLRQLYGSYSEQLRFTLVGEITKKGAFDESVKDVVAIIHTASPVHQKAQDPGEIIGPAVSGTIEILESALKYGSQLERVVITSSCAAILVESEVDVTVSELDWNDSCVEECNAKGRAASQLSKYSASKVLAERAAWKFYETHKSNIAWSLTVLNPPWIFGPTLHDVPDFAAINPSWKQWLKAVTQGAESQLTRPGHGWVDVRDVAEAHVRALEVPAAGGERIIICAGQFVWQDWIDAAAHLDPPTVSCELAKTVPGTIRRAIRFDPRKQEQILAIKFRSMEDVSRDSLENYRARGWVI